MTVASERFGLTAPTTSLQNVPTSNVSSTRGLAGNYPSTMALIFRRTKYKHPSAHYWSCWVVILYLASAQTGTLMAESHETVILPKPSTVSEHSLETLLQQRRSVRTYQDETLTLTELGQLLWAAQGTNHPEGLRTAPSAGALYPLELYVTAGNVEGLVPALYHYDSQDHTLRKTVDGDLRKTLARVALKQSWLADAAAVIAFTAVYDRTTRKYGQRGIRYVDIEVGHAAQNLFLQAEALELGTVVVGAFDDEKIAHTLRLSEDTKPVILMPVGKRGRY